MTDFDKNSIVLDKVKSIPVPPDSADKVKIFLDPNDNQLKVISFDGTISLLVDDIEVQEVSADVTADDYVYKLTIPNPEKGLEEFKKKVESNLQSQVNSALFTFTEAIELTVKEFDLLKSAFSGFENRVDKVLALKASIEDLNQIRKTISGIKPDINITVGSIKIGDPDLTVTRIDDTFVLDIVFPRADATTVTRGGGGGGSRFLRTLKDVDVAGVTNGQVLQYNSATGKWEPGFGGSGIATINSTSPDTSANFSILAGSGIEIINGVNGLTVQLYSAISGSISNDIGNNAEVGQSFSSVNLTWSLNKVETSQSLNQGIGALAIGLRAYEHVDTITTNRTYTLTASDGTNVTTPSTSITFRRRRFWGTDATVSPTSAIFTDLSDELSTSRTKTFTIASGGGEYIYYAYPKSYSQATFYVNGFLTTFIEFEDAWTNAYSNTVDYYIYRSEFVQFGSNIQIEVV